MTDTKTDQEGLTLYSRFVLFGIVLPLLFIAGVQLFILARYSSAIDWGKPLAIAFTVFLVLGILISGANLLANRILSK